MYFLHVFRFSPRGGPVFTSTSPHNQLLPRLPVSHAQSFLPCFPGLHTPLLPSRVALPPEVSSRMFLCSPAATTAAAAAASAAVVAAAAAAAAQAAPTFGFTRADLDFALYGYSSPSDSQSGRAHAISGIKVADTVQGQGRS
jgi:hypothetical protein